MDKIIENILHFKIEMIKLDIEVKAIDFDENTYDLIVRFLERNCSKFPISCECCPYMKTKTKFLGIEIRKG